MPIQKDDANTPPRHEVILSYLFIGLPILMIVGYVIFLVRFTTSAWVHVLIWMMFIYMAYLYDIKGTLDGKDVKPSASRRAFTEKVLVPMHLKVESPFHGVYSDPHIRSFVFLPKHVDLIDLFRQLEFIRSYDLPSYNRALFLTERFLKTYYRLIETPHIEECQLGMSILRDIRSELLNTMHGIHLNIPKYFKKPIHRNKQPLDAYIHTRIRYMQAFTYKKMRILSRKCNPRNTYDFRYKPPSGADWMQEEGYSLF